MKDITEMTKEELLAVPIREYDVRYSIYESIVVVNKSGKLHDSGYGLIAVIGVVEGKPVEIASMNSDSLELNFNDFEVKIESLPKSRCSHFFASPHIKVKFVVGMAFSSLEISVRRV